jgi:AraC-like DNA-binding protein
VDVLSNVLSTVRLTGAVFFDVQAFPPWVSTTPPSRTFRQHVMPNAEHVIAFHVLLTGSCWVELPDVMPAIRLNAGNLVVIPMGDEHILSSARGMRGETPLDTFKRPRDRPLPVPFVLNQGGGPDCSHFVCGYFGCDTRPFNPLLDALPRILDASLSTASQDWLATLVRAAVDESHLGTAGTETMLAKIAELMFVEVIRKYIDRLPDHARGWCSGIRDPQIGAALNLIHDRPAHPWTVEALAREIGASRSVFAERFVSLVGVSPIHYLSRWRLQVAANLLTQGMTLGRAAAQVGYESEAAFNRAFKKYVGLPPGAWRKRRQDEGSIPRGSTV